MLEGVLNKKKQRDKLNNEIKDLEKKILGFNAEISWSEGKKYNVEKDAGEMGCGATIFFILGMLWMLIAFDTFNGDWNGANIIITLLPSPIVLFIGWTYISSWNKSSKLSNKVYEYSKQKKSVEEEVDNLKKIVPKLDKEIMELEKDYHNELVNHFKTNYDNNNNGEIDSLENKDDFLKYLQANQDKIIEVSEKMGDDYIHVLVKINDKLNLKRESINKSLAEVMKIKNGFSESSNIDVYESFIKDEIHYYNSLLANSLFMASSLVNNDRITFRTIYEKFDKLNIFNSHYENQTLKLLNSINNNLVKIIQEIRELNFSVTSAIQDLTYATQENTEKITQELQNIDSSINFNTLIAGINAYQNYKISKNTKSLRS